MKYAMLIWLIVLDYKILHIMEAKQIKPIIIASQQNAKQS